MLVAVTFRAHEVWPWTIDAEFIETTAVSTTCVVRSDAPEDSVVPPDVVGEVMLPETDSKPTE